MEQISIVSGFAVSSDQDDLFNGALMRPELGA
jgi:hypothetical protein